MRNPLAWRATKYDGIATLSASRDPQALAPSSRLSAQLVADFYARVLPVYARGRLLDLGCGAQPLYGAYRNRVSYAVAADWPSSLHATSNIDAFCDLTQPLPFRDGSFDTVLFSDVLEHLPDPALALREIARILAPSGVLLMNTPFMYWIHEAPHDYLRHSRYSLTRLAEESRLDVVEVAGLGGAGDVLVDIVSKCLLGVPVLGSICVRLLQGIAVSRRNGPIATALRKRTETHFPLGHGMVARKRAAA
ncbi:class I SAM-dependent methyltransferase [Nocardioides sp. AN3]